MNLFPRLCALLVLSLSQAAQAYQPLITDYTGTQGAGGRQAELSWSSSRNTDTTAPLTTRTRTLPFVYTQGYSDTLDVYFGLSFSRSKDDTGLVDHTEPNPTLGTKWRFLEQDGGWSLGFKPEIQFATETAKTSWSALLIASRETDFGEFHANLAYARVNHKTGTDRKDQWRLSVAPVFHVNGQIKVALDLGYLTNPTTGERAGMAYALLGGVYSPNDKLDFALGWQRNLNEPGNRVHQVSLGLTYRF